MDETATPYGPAQHERRPAADAGTTPPGGGRVAVATAAGLLVLTGLFPLGWGLVMIAGDLEDRGEMFDGLGLFLGLLLGGAGAVVLLVAGFVWWLGRRSVVAAGWTLTGLGGLGLVVAVGLLAGNGREVSVPWAVGGLVLLALGLWAALRGRPRPPAGGLR